MKQFQRRVADHAISFGAPFDLAVDEMYRLFAELPSETDEGLR
jgi:hypothetical protein